jgi:hypothetical protein
MHSTAGRGQASATYDALRENGRARSTELNLLGPVQVARVGVGVLVGDLDGAEHELAARLAVDQMS